MTLSLPKPSSTGLAGEFRVMSELLLRGFNPAKSYLDNGADLILDNGARIEVKSAHLHEDKSNQRLNPKYKVTERYQVHIRHRKHKISNADFMIFWCIEDQWFFIVPRDVFIKNERGFWIGRTNNYHLMPYKNAWHLLDTYKR